MFMNSTLRKWSLHKLIVKVHHLEGLRSGLHICRERTTCDDEFKPVFVSAGDRSTAEGKQPATPRPHTHNLLKLFCLSSCGWNCLCVFAVFIHNESNDEIHGVVLY